MNLSYTLMNWQNEILYNLVNKMGLTSSLLGDMLPLRFYSL